MLDTFLTLQNRRQCGRKQITHFLQHFTKAKCKLIILKTEALA